MIQEIKPTIYYIENLTVDSWVFSILPYFLSNRKSLPEAGLIYYFHNSKLGLWLANFTLGLAKKKLQRANFSQEGVWDEDGNLVWMNAMKEAVLLQENITRHPDFQKIVNTSAKTNSLKLFLGKWIMCSDLMTTDVFLLSKFAFFVRCVALHEKIHNPAGIVEKNVFMFVQERPWLEEIKKFVKFKGIHPIPTVNFSLYGRVSFLKWDHLLVLIKDLCKKALYGLMVWRYKFKKIASTKGSNEIVKDEEQFKDKGPCIAIEHYGYLNFNSPELFSDLFFLQNSSLNGRDLLIYFGLPQVPVTDRDWSEIKKRGMSAVATNPLATTTAQVPIFRHKRKKFAVDGLENQGQNNKEFFSRAWLQRYLKDYYHRCHRWEDFFTQHNVKIHVTWFKYSPDHCAKIDALKNTGGIGVVYQRSYDFFLAPWSFTSADVVFGFSKLGAHVGQDKNSMIPYYVVTGYLGDYRFGLLQKRAKEVRTLLQNHGAQKIVAYFDEHARDDSRWNLAYNVTLKNYSYLLNKVLENPWFGLILKPKVPSTLRLRLGPVSDLLCRAEKTGRCFVFEDGTLQGSYPPAVASLGADITIHGHLFAATAGIESALAGTPTLILDYEGTPDTPLHEMLAKGRVIFRDIHHLWETCLEHWHHPTGIPGFADWSNVLEEFDPFRDGRSAQRMGTYLGWLIEGFKAGLTRETVLADAAERYSKIWGKDKILSVNYQGEIFSPLAGTVSVS